MENSCKILPSKVKDKLDRPIKIRAYTDSDYNDLKEMYDSFEPKGLEAGLPPPDEKVRHEWIDQMVSSFFNVLALHRGRIIGHAALDIDDANACPEYSIFISKEFRDRGIGTRLSEIMKEIARDAGCRKIWLTVRTGNTCAIRVFKKVRFEFTGDIGIEREMELIIRKSRK
ncbi:MAG: GNAT family N-acetyltransferase [Deltaproteobacteria bacterium]|nr:GNAT family N-acetyltransferase [Deltaproteobacteria bacterium]MBL7205545.1 GNAT family N-acetyltransferase [Desulfobacteraceae bacterium]